MPLSKPERLPLIGLCLPSTPHRCTERATRIPVSVECGHNICTMAPPLTDHRSLPHWFTCNMYVPTPARQTSAAEMCDHIKLHATIALAGFFSPTRRDLLSADHLILVHSVAYKQGAAYWWNFRLREFSNSQQHRAAQPARSEDGENLFCVSHREACQPISGVVCGGILELARK